MDNTRHRNYRRAQACIEGSKADHLPHPDYSPDLAPSDFFLFGYTKRGLSDCDCESREDRLNTITEFFTESEQAVLQSPLDAWADRLKWVVKHEGKDYTQ
jgi:histone-lysine N-methyltransferase SETMAR